MNFLKNARVMMTGFALAQAIPLLAYPLLTRLFSPDAFGLLTLFTSLVAALTVIATLRLDLALLLAGSDEEADELVGLIVVLLGSLLTILGLASLFSAPRIATAFGFEGQPLWVWCLLPVTAATVTFQVTAALLARHRRFGPVASAQVVNQASYVALAAAIGFLASMTMGLVLARFFGQVLAAAVLLLALSTIAKVTIRRPSFEGVGRLWTRFHQFVMYNTPYSLVGVVGREMPVFAFAAISATTAAGYYGLARTLLSAPAALMSASLSQVFYREAVEHKGGPHLQELTVTILRLTLKASAPLFAFVAVWGDVLFGFLFGFDWAEAGVYAMILSVAAWLTVQTSWPERLFETVGRQDASFRVQISFDLFGALSVATTTMVGTAYTLTVAAFAVVNCSYHLTYLWAMFSVASFDRMRLVRVLVSGMTLFALCAGVFYGVRVLGPLSPLVLSFLCAGLAMAAAFFYLVREIRNLSAVTSRHGEVSGA